MAEQLAPYLGEFLFVPWALELSVIEPCDYACAYCFAILGDRARKDYGRATGTNANGVKHALNLLQNSHKRKTLEAYFLNHKYPVLMSNRTDPFGRKNRVQTIALLEILGELGVRAAFQTKGFIRPDLDFDRVMDMIPPSWFYVTIAQDNDELRKRIEPGATAIDYRFEMIQELTRRGHKVCVGWNPFVPEWVTDYEAFLQRIMDSGAEQILMQMLHLHSSNVQRMTPREKENMHGGDLEWWGKIAGKKNPPPEWIAYYREVTKAVRDLGLKNMGMSAYAPVDVWGEVRGLYDNQLPTVLDFIYHCSQTKQEGDLILFDEWLSWCIERLPKVKKGLGHAIRIRSWTLADKIKISEGWDTWKTDIDYPTLLRISWQYMDRLSTMTPYASSAACKAYDAKDRPLVDDRGLQALVFAPCEHPLDTYSKWIIG